MTQRGRSAGFRAVMLIPVMLIAVALRIGMLQAGLVFGPAWAAMARLAGLMPGADAAAPFALPSLATLAAPALGISIPSAALAAIPGSWLFWPVAAVAGMAGWLVRLRHSRWRRIAVERDEPADTLSQFWPDPAPEPAPLAPVEVITPAPLERAPPQGADLVARARFVAMSFSFPETGRSRGNFSPDGPAGWPLHMNCQPTRFTLTLRHAALGYRLEFCNRGAESLGPLIIRADLIASESRIAYSREPGFADDALPPCHYLDSLPAGDTIALTGELRLPLARIVAMRLGVAELLVPLMRVCAESTGDAQARLSVSACFAIGLPPLSAGGGIQPFRLDTGPGIWRKLSARRLVLADLF